LAISASRRFGCLISRMREQGFQVAIGVDQLGRGLHADAGDTGNIVGAVAAQGLNLDHLVGSDAEFLPHLGFADRPVGHRVAHHDAAVCDELHHVLVGREDRHLGAGFDGMPRIGGDQVVGLEIVHLDATDAKGIRRAPHMLQLRRQIVRHFTPVGLVVTVDFVAETAPRGVENDRDMVGVGLAQVLVEHVAEDHYDFGRHAVRFALEPLGFGVAGAGKIGAEDEARTVDQEDVVRRCRRRGIAGRPLGDNGTGCVIHFRLLLRRVGAAPAGAAPVPAGRPASRPAAPGRGRGAAAWPRRHCPPPPG
jgi:hypothetical protein